MFGIFGISMMKNKVKFCSFSDPEIDYYEVGEKEVIIYLLYY